MTDANFRSAGQTLMIEDSANQKIQSEQIMYDPWCSDQESSPSAQLKFSMSSEGVLANYKAFSEFAHFLWETTKPATVLTDEKSVRHSSRRKNFHQRCGTHLCVLKVNFKKAHTSGSVKRAADLLNRVELKVTEKIRLRFR